MIVKNLNQLNKLAVKISNKISLEDCIFLRGKIGVGKTTFARCLINNLQKRNKIIRLTFKISMAVFFGFSIFDILFGDRMELWEHGTFLILATIHYVYILFAV